MEKEKTQGIATFQTEQEALQSGLRIIKRVRSLDSVEILISELKSVGSGNLQFTLFATLTGIAAGLFIAVGIVLVTITFTEKQIMAYVGFLTLFIISAFASLAFSILATIFYKKSTQQLNEILANVKVDVEERINIPTNTVI